jgi:hypothetical protein
MIEIKNEQPVVTRHFSEVAYYECPLTQGLGIQAVPG